MDGRGGRKSQKETEQRILKTGGGATDMAAWLDVVATKKDDKE